MKTISINGFKIESVNGTPVNPEIYSPAKLEGTFKLQADETAKEVLAEIIKSQKIVGLIEVTKELFISLRKTKQIRMYHPARGEDVDYKVYYRSSKTNKIFIKEI